ncbi:hypothetical protein LU631_18750 [Erwinia tracheiphila]|uniref:Uncharacterized protein n=1 Tax=Erwinia tracheiphila TaxID=65700 RepID=A0A0M2KDA0_9GAMM|nr:hypothetical protein [Erwinia tracheiphila]KKF35208.1 hypothetical protein SY86_06845 [Erwinia tracheiphila]UIA86863.1 hypothetical protein LU631_18750 [Erwinia tracheiphila]UIA95219.1 hypothetical protein LU633_17205 [Erwinia tracheiphila]
MTKKIGNEIILSTEEIKNLAELSYAYNNNRDSPYGTTARGSIICARMGLRKFLLYVASKIERENFFSNPERIKQLLSAVPLPPFQEYNVPFPFTQKQTSAVELIITE